MKKQLILGLGIVLGSLVTMTVQAEEEVQMYRVYNPNNGEHFYTANPQEKTALVTLGWHDEGIGWLAPTNGAPVYRVYNPNSGEHHFTTNGAEKNMLVNVGWQDEGTGFYSAPPARSIAVYRMFNPNAHDAGSHHYTTSIAETYQLDRLGWKDEGIGWYGLPPKFVATEIPVKVALQTDGGRLINQNTFLVKEGTDYTAIAPEYPGFKVVGKATQTVTVNQEQTITFTYTKVETPEITSTDIPHLEKEMVANIEADLNHYRMQKEGSLLAFSEPLQNIANQRAVELVHNFSHIRPDGTSYVTLKDEMGYKGELADSELIFELTPDQPLDWWAKNGTAEILKAYMALPKAEQGLERAGLNRGATGIHLVKTTNSKYNAFVTSYLSLEE